MEFVNLAKLLAAGQLKFKDGEALLLGQAITMVPIDWVVTLQKSLEGRESENLVYYTAKEMGVRWFKNMHDFFKISPEDIIRWGINVLSLAGWGVTSTPEINRKEKFYTVRLEDGVESKEFGKVGYAVDHFVRGCYAAGAKVLFGGECDSVELGCVSSGDRFCRFIAQPTKQFDKGDSLVKRQLKLPK